MTQRIIAVVLLLMLNAQVHAQSRLEQCATRRSEALTAIVKMKKDTDSLANQRLVAIDKDWQDCVVGASMPAFQRGTIQGGLLDGGELKGKIVLINFWFTSCAPCIAEMPGLNQLVDEFKGNNVVFIGFTFENKDKIEKEFLPSHRFDFTIVSDAGDLEKVFGINDYPSTFVVDNSGRIRKAWSGGPSGPQAKDEVYNKIKPVLAELIKEKNNDLR